MKKMLRNFFWLSFLMVGIILSSTGSFASSYQSPTRPTNLQAIEIQDTSVRLRWSNEESNSWVRGYEVSMNNRIIGEVGTNGARISQLKEDTTYAFKVRSVDVFGVRSSYSSILTLTTSKNSSVTVEPPKNLSIVEAGDTFIRIRWDAPNNSFNIDEYDVYLNEQKIGSVSSTLARISKLIPNTIYNIKVKAVDFSGNDSTFSNIVGIKTTPSASNVLSAPINLTTTEVTTNMIRINWEKGTLSDGVIGYKVYLDNELLGSVSGTAARIRNLSPSTVYSLKVLAFDGQNRISPDSSTIVVRTLSLPTTEVEPPQNTKVTEITSNSVRLRWDAPDDNDDIIGYNVYQNNVKMGMVTGTGAFISSLQSGKTYEFRITSVHNDNIESTKTPPLFISTL